MEYFKSFLIRVLIKFQEIFAIIHNQLQDLSLAIISKNHFVVVLRAKNVAL